MNNKIMIPKWLVLLAVCLVFTTINSVTAQTTAVKEKKVDFLGSVENGKYKNTFLGFEMLLPNFWLSLSQEDQETAKSIGSEGLKAQKSSNDKAIDRAIGAETVVLLYAKKPLGAVGNSSMAVGVAKQPSSRITAKMVVEAAKSIFLKSPDNKLKRDIEIENIGGKQVASMIVDLNLFGHIVQIKYYAAMVQDYSVTFSMVAFDPETLKEMETSLRSTKFNIK